MADRQLASEQLGLQRTKLLVFFGVLLLSSCAAAPFLIPAAIEFARNLLVTSNKNYGGKYSADMNQLMMRVSTPYVAMGLPPGTPQSALMPPTMLQQQQQQQLAMMNQMAGQSGQGMPGQPGMPGAYYDPNNPSASLPGMNVQAPVYGMQQFSGQYGGQYGQFGGQYGGQFGGQYGAQFGSPYGSQYGAPYGYTPQGMPPSQPGYPAVAPGSTAPFPTPGYPQQGIPGYQQTPMQSLPMQQQMYQQPMDPYQQQAMGGMQGYQGYQQMPMQPYQQQMVPNGQLYGYPGVGYPGQIYPRSVAGSGEPVAFDVAFVRQVTSATGKQITLMQDGETLKGEPNGDRFKVIVRTNCECFVYIISIDGSGWAQPIFPVANGSVTNPLKSETEQVLPDGPYWFTLDEFKGVETFFLVASPARRTDIEESLTQLAAQQRPAGKVDARVEEPAVIPNGFGKTEPGHATNVGDETQQQTQVSALSYVAAKPGEDVRITRWFRHQ